MRLFLLSDLHQDPGAPEVRLLEGIKTLCKRIRSDTVSADGPFLFVLLGDLLNAGKEDAAEPICECLKMLREELTGYEVLIEAVPGNHDRHGNDISAFDSVLREIGISHSFGKESTYVREVEGINFIFTDTTQEDYNGPGELDLAAVKAAIKKGKENVLFFHHALTHYHVSEHDRVMNGEKLSRELFNLGIRYVFHGHTHQADVTIEKDRVIEIGCGSLSKSMRDMPEGIYNQFMAAYARDGAIIRVDRLIFTKDLGLAIEEAYPGRSEFLDPMTIGKIHYDAPPQPYLPRRILTNEASKDSFQRMLLGETGKPIRNVLHEKDKLLLLSDSGEGKSVELQNVAHEAAEDCYFSVLILLRNYLGEPIDELIPESYRNLYPSRLLLLFDGYDELASEEYYSLFESSLAQYISDHPGVRVLVTSRSNFCRAELGDESRTLRGFWVYRFEELNKTDLEAYLREKKIEPAHFFQIAKDVGVSSLLSVPFYLNGLSDIYLKQNSLPERTAVMHEMIRLRFHLDEEKFAGRLGDEERKLFTILGKLALVMQQMHRVSLVEGDEYQKLIPELDDRKLLKKSGLLEHLGEEIRFSHNNFREYLCAEEMRSYDLDKQISLISDGTHVFPKWINVLGYLCGMSDNLLPWLREYAPEVILKFEPDRLKEDERDKLLMHLFEYYEERELWFANEFCSPGEIARFACSNNTLTFLLDKLRTDGHFFSRYTALEMLSAFPSLLGRKDEVCRVLLDFCEHCLENGKGGLCREAMQTISALCLNDALVSGELVRLLRYTNNTKARCGLYLFLMSTHQENDFSYVLAKGIANLEKQKGESTDEEIVLLEALEHISTAYGIADVLNEFLHCKEISDRFVREVLNKLIDRGSEVYKQENKALLRAVIDCCFDALTSGIADEIDACVRFFAKTKTVQEAVLGIAEYCKNGKWEFGYFLSFNGSFFDCAEKEYLAGSLPEKLFISAVSDYSTDEQYQRYQKSVLEKSGVELKRAKQRINRTELHTERIRQYYNLLFDRRVAEETLGDLIALAEDPEITVGELVRKHILEWDSPLRKLQYVLRRNVAEDTPTKLFFEVVDWEECSFFEAIEQWQKEKTIPPTEEQREHLRSELLKMLEEGAISDDVIFDLRESSRGKCRWIVQAAVMLDAALNEEHLLQMVKIPDYYFLQSNDKDVKYSFLRAHLNRNAILKQIIADLQERRIEEMTVRDHIEFCREEKCEDAVEAATEICRGTYKAPDAQYAALRYLYEQKGKRYLEWEVLPYASGELLCVIAKNWKDVSRESLRKEMEKRFNCSPTQEMKERLIELNSYLALKCYADQVVETHAAQQKGEEYSDTVRAIGEIQDPALLPLLGVLLNEVLKPDFKDADHITLRGSLRDAFVNCSHADADAALQELQKHRPVPGSPEEANKQLYYDIENLLLRGQIGAADKSKSLEEAIAFLMKSAPHAPSAT